MARVISFEVGENTVQANLHGHAITVYLDRINPGMRQAILRYGVKQLLSDVRAGKSSDESVELVKARAEAIMDQNRNTWVKETRDRKVLPLTLEALIRMLRDKGVADSEQKAKTRWDTLSQKERSRLANAVDLKPYIEQVRAERAANRPESTETVSVEDVLGDFE